ncbi:MAG: hypothetical protein NVS9B11_00280 [Candidatus Dormibacteraceae bacterium]
MSGVWVLFPFIPPIRLSTVIAFVATLAILAWFRRSPLLAVVAGMAWLSAFEIVYMAVGTIYGRHDALHLFFLTFSMSGWVVAAYVAGIRPHPAWLGAWGLLFLGWIAFGFHPNLIERPDQFSLAQELFNVATKDGLAAIFVIGGLTPFRRRARIAATSTLDAVRNMDSVRT